MSTPCVISVDWDFFIYTGVLQGPFHGKSAINGTPIEVPGRLLFDWGHNEDHPPGLQDLLWATRYAAFENYSLNFGEMVKLMQSPSDFSKTVYRKLNPSFSAPFFTADSHKLIWPVVRDMAEAHGPLHVVSFDAHSDLGYGTKDDGSVRCDNWLLEGLKAGHVKSAVVVYPNWRGDEEWSELDDKTASKYDVTHMTWSEWLKSKHDLNIVASFACRSSAWTPPHLDGEWKAFVESWHSLPAHCLECLWAPGTIGQAHHACTPREWDMETVERERVFMQEAIQRQQDRKAQ